MTSSETVLKQVDSILTDLVATATKLLEVSKGAISEEVIAPLQEEQQALISDLESLDTVLAETNASLESSPEGASIQEKLRLFQELNGRFIDNIRVRQGLIDIEIKEVRKGKNQLGQLRVVYGTKGNADGAKTPKKKRRINTVS